MKVLLAGCNSLDNFLFVYNSDYVLKSVSRHCLAVKEMQISAKIGLNMLKHIDYILKSNRCTALLLFSLGGKVFFFFAVSHSLTAKDSEAEIPVMQLRR